MRILLSDLIDLIPSVNERDFQAAAWSMNVHVMNIPPQDI
jgi:hypothetical protein